MSKGAMRMREVEGGGGGGGGYNNPLLQLFVGIVDAKLLEGVALKDLEAKYIKDPNKALLGAAFIGAFAFVYDGTVEIAPFRCQFRETSGREEQYAVHLPSGTRQLAKAPILTVIRRRCLANVATRSLIDALDKPVKHTAVDSLGKCRDRLECILRGEGDHGLLSAGFDGPKTHCALELLSVDAPTVTRILKALFAPVSSDTAAGGASDLLWIKGDITKVKDASGGLEEP